MANSVSLRFSLAPGEYVTAARAYYRHRVRPRARLLAGGVVGLVVLGLLSLFAFQRPEFGLLCLAVAVLIPVIALVAVEGLPRFSARRQQGLSEELRWQFASQGVQLETGRGNSRLPWAGYGRVLENEQFYFLEFAGNMLSVIPKRAFANPESESAFRALLRRKVARGIDKM